MALTSNDIRYIFKVFGKAIKLGLMGAATSLDYQAMSSVTNRQISPSGISSEFDEIKYIGVPLEQNVEGLANVADSLGATMKTVVASYLSNSLAAQLSLTTGSNPNTVAAALATQMTAVGDSVAPSGSQGANANGYAMYFYNNFGVSLPQNASPTIPDVWINNVLIP